MAKQVAPFPPPRKPPADQCPVVADFYWGGWYKARCIRPRHDGDLHDDGIAYSKIRPPEGTDDESED